MCDENMLHTRIYRVLTMLLFVKNNIRLSHILSARVFTKIHTGILGSYFLYPE